MSTEEIAALTQRLQTLESQLADLRAIVDGRRESKEPTMRARLRCPACNGRKIGHAPQILDRGDGDARQKLALFKPNWWSGKSQGELEAYMCMSCGLMEWYVREPGSVEAHRKFFRILDGAAPEGDGPYR